MTNKRELTFSEIMSLALKAGQYEWRYFLKDDQEPLLHQCLWYERAWMFFRNPSIDIPKEASMKKCSIVVSIYGEVRTTADFFPNFNECMDYLKIMSDHFEDRDL